MNLKDIRGWLAEDNKTTLASLIERFKVTTVLEIGTCYGLSAGWFAQRVERVVCVDRWDEIPEADVPADIYDIFLRNMLKLGVRDKIVAVRGDSHLAATAEILGMFDLVYLDGDHTETGCLQDIEMYGHKARAILCGDDYGDLDTPGLRGVTAAIDSIEHQHVGRFWWVEK